MKYSVFSRLVKEKLNMPIELFSMIGKSDYFGHLSYVTYKGFIICSTSSFYELCGEDESVLTIQVNADNLKELIRFIDTFLEKYPFIVQDYNYASGMGVRYAKNKLHISQPCYSDITQFYTRLFNHPLMIEFLRNPGLLSRMQKLTKHKFLTLSRIGKLIRVKGNRYVKYGRYALCIDTLKFFSEDTEEYKLYTIKSNLLGGEIQYGHEIITRVY